MKQTAPIYFVAIFGKSQPTDHNRNNSDVNATAWKCSPVYNTLDPLTEICLLEMEEEAKDWLEKLLCLFQHLLKDATLFWS